MNQESIIQKTVDYVKEVLSDAEGGHKGREIYNPGIQPCLTMTKKEYKSSKAPTLNHFYEKLLRLKDRMNTETGKALADHRHRFMESFLEEFYGEWNGDLQAGSVSDKQALSQ